MVYTIDAVLVQRYVQKLCRTSNVELDQNPSVRNQGPITDFQNQMQCSL